VHEVGAALNCIKVMEMMEALGYDIELHYVKREE